MLAGASEQTKTRGARHGPAGARTRRGRARRERCVVLRDGQCPGGDERQSNACTGTHEEGRVECGGAGEHAYGAGGRVYGWLGGSEEGDEGHVDD